MIYKIFRAKDVPGQWVAHDITSDVVSQGNSPEHALKMLLEAIAIVASDPSRCSKHGSQLTEWGEELVCPECILAADVHDWDGTPDYEKDEEADEDDTQ